MRPALIALALSMPLFAADLEFKERFADPATRTESLGRLVPETRDWYFYRALDHQLNGRTKECEAVLTEWRAAIDRKERPVESAGLEELENRALLLAWPANPDKAADDLIRHLGLEFNDTRPDAKADEKLPSTLPPESVSREVFEKEAAAQYPDRPWEGYRQDPLYAELDKGPGIPEAERRWLLSHLARADHPAIPALIAAELAPSSQRPKANLPESIPLAAYLTVAQMKELMRLEPRVKGHEKFVLRYLAAVAPADNAGLLTDVTVRADYAKRCLEFTATLPPALASLHLAALRAHLSYQRDLGNYPQRDFLEYLEMPRQSHPLLRSDAAKGIPENDRFFEATRLTATTNDSELIPAYLDHFLSSADSAAPFAPFIEEKRLALYHAEARLLAGADPAKWSAALDPGAFRDLRDLTTITFAPGQPQLLAADAQVKLKLVLKNTPELLVRIYPLDLAAWYSTHAEQPSSSLDLDGLVPEREIRMTYAQAPLVRHQETIDLPDLKGRGIWIVETVSRGVAARALISKGKLLTTPERIDGGFVVRAFDETGKPATDATLHVDGQALKPDADGRMIVKAGFKSDKPHAYVTGAGLAAPIALDLTPSTPVLDARFHVDREQLIANQKATLRMALALTDHEVELPLERLQNLTLTLGAKLGDGVTTQRVISDGLKPATEQTVDFLVPPDARTISLRLTAKVTPTTGGEPENLSTEREFAINGVLDTDKTGVALLSQTTRGYRLDLRGRNGEPLASKAAQVKFTHRDYTKPVSASLRTNGEGQVELGSLTGIETLVVSGNEIEDTSLDLESLRHSGPDFAEAITMTPHDTWQLPVDTGAGPVDRLRFRLMRRQDDKVVENASDHLSVEKNQLVVRALPVGTYALYADDRRWTITVLSGPLVSGPGREDLIFGFTGIEHRQMPVLPSIVKSTLSEKALDLELTGFTPDTRITLVGVRFLHPGDSWNALIPHQRPRRGYHDQTFQGCSYLTDRKQDDEMRYIFDRRSATAYPGTLLPRPGMLVNRWTAQETTTRENAARLGDEGRITSDGVLGMASGNNKLSRGAGGSAVLSDRAAMDFLASNSVVRYSMKPGLKGSFQMPLDDFRTCQSIHVVVTDGSFMSRTIIPLPPSSPPLRDLRLNRPLDPTKHHTGTRGAAFLARGEETAIDNMLDADWRAFTTLEEAWSYLAGATPQSEHGLSDLAFLKDWSELKETDKLAALNESSGHELHLFLFRKDRAFFDKFVKPRLAEKMEPTFIDDYLLERDLTSYLRPYAWEKLNAAEKALLAHALPAARERIATDLRQRWELDRPDADAENNLFLATLRGQGLSETDSLGLARNAPTSGATVDQVLSEPRVTGASYIGQKLRAIIIPSIDFEDMTLEEAAEQLRRKSREFDTVEIDPSRKGVNFVVRFPSGTPPETREMRIKKLQLQNVPLGTVLKYICGSSRLCYKVEEYAVVFTALTETGEDFFTRSFTVPDGFSAMLEGNEAAAPADPFAAASSSSSSQNRLSARPAISELLKKAGVLFPDGATATLVGNKLLVTSTPTELDKIEQLNEALGVKEAPADPFAAPDATTSYKSALILPPPVLNPDTTRVWRESNYYKYRGSTDEEFIPLNRFWIDLASWDGKGPFLSPHFNECIHNANEALMCLALLDLPEHADKPEVRAEAAKLHVKARAPMLLFYKDTRETDKVAKDAPVLVRETLHRLDESHRTVEGRRQQASLGDKLVAGEHYGISLVITNPSGDERRVDVLAQIPAGAMPLKGLPVTLSKTVTLKPYGVENLEMAFYFPAPGAFTLYPLHVTEGDTVLAHTEARKLQVDAEAAAPDTASWPVLARDGTNEQVLERLRRDNLHTLDLDEILWRLQDKAFFTTVTALLRERLVFSMGVSAYGFKHRDAIAIRECLENSEMTGKSGGWLTSPLLDIRPQVHLDFETLEFDPLVNRRAHRFAENPRLSNQEAAEFQEKQLDLLAWKPALDDGDQLRLALMLQLQDRTAESIERFNKIDAAKLPGRTAYDYLHAVLLFAMQKPDDARAIALRYADHPLALWRGRFAEVVSQADEIATLAKGRPAAATPDKKEMEPSLEIASNADGALQLKHRALKQTRLQLFHVDLEVLFSKDPFLKGGMNALPPIRANETREVALSDNGETRVELPESFRHGNVLVAADTGTKQVLRVLDSRAIDLLRNPAERTVQALDASGKPLVKSYVKVYVEKRDGTTAFLKDGYTDLRGKFDYLTHSFDPEIRIKRVAVLVIHPDAGAKTMVFEP
ncbi:hypothetical protein KBB96_11195 [Luteolibacter ambystomatis]|uniref:Alpha-2-macroglobulin domain-containing protein n=1 Tax=Luteolibacter ambystomatis TaxID=2824561 RepID=A0A975IY23_9BACT|nr:hypothetical protein [Luteolibacter ambystomatis]QUE49438.1 hypothetical protein KBB96_11195 [Luteolibacter ambystomatis]